MLFINNQIITFMANKVLQKAIAAAFALALPLGASAKPDLNNYNLVDSIVGIGTTITDELVVSSTSVGKSNNGLSDYDCYETTTPEEFTGWLAFQSAGSSGNVWAITTGTINNTTNCYGLNSIGNTRAALIYNLGEIDLVRIVCATNSLNFNEGNYTVETATENDSTVYYVTMNGGDSIAFYQTKYSYACITDIYFYQFSETATIADYTIKYVDEDGDELQDARTGTAAVGDTITVLDMDKEDIYIVDESSDTTKYVYSSDDANGGVVLTADGATITVTFKESGTYSYTVTAAYGDETEVIESGTAHDQDEVTVYYKEYILSDDGTLYYKAKNSSNPYWGTTFTIDGADYSETITYTDSGIDSVLFYTEGEDLDGMTEVTASNALIRCSQGAAAYAATNGTDVTVTTLSAGKYQIYIGFFNASSSTPEFVIEVGDVQYSFTVTSKVNQEVQNTVEFEITAESDVVILGGYGGSYYGYDFIYVVKTGEVTDDDTDGISEVSAEIESGDAVSAPVYSLSGVMVREAGEGVSGLGKGVYIMNGKKIMVK